MSQVFATECVYQRAVNEEWGFFAELLSRNGMLAISAGSTPSNFSFKVEAMSEASLVLMYEFFSVFIFCG